MGKEPQCRDDVMTATLDILSDGIPRMAKEICRELRCIYGWTMINKSMVNSVLYFDALRCTSTTTVAISHIKSANVKQSL